MSFQGAPRDHVLGGLSPRRHHDPAWSLELRAVGYSFLAEFDINGDAVLQHEGQDPLSVGDDQSWVLWRAAEGKRPISSFSPAFSAGVSSAPVPGSLPSIPPNPKQSTQTRAQGSNSLLPLFAPGQPDDR